MKKRKIELAVGGTIEGPSKHIDLIEKRDNFVVAYCKEKGWAPEDLSIAQICEIRAQDGWINPE